MFLHLLVYWFQVCVKRLFWKRGKKGHVTYFLEKTAVVLTVALGHAYFNDNANELKTGSGKGKKLLRLLMLNIIQHGLGSKCYGKCTLKLKKICIIATFSLDLYILCPMNCKGVKSSERRGGSAQVQITLLWVLKHLLTDEKLYQFHKQFHMGNYNLRFSGKFIEILDRFSE